MTLRMDPVENSYAPGCRSSPAAWVGPSPMPSEKRYLRAMAELGPGPHRSGDAWRSE